MAHRSTPPRALDSPLVNAAVSGALTLYPSGRAPRALRAALVAVPAALGAGLGLLIGYALATGRFDRSAPGSSATDGVDERADEASRAAERAGTTGTASSVYDRMARAVADARHPSFRVVVVTAAVTAGSSAVLGAGMWFSLALDRWLETRLIAAGVRRPRWVMASSAAVLGYVDARTRNQGAPGGQSVSV